MNIVLIGFMGTGKSAAGSALAHCLGARLIDTDAEIERAAGKSVRRIFAEDGETVFREMETALLERLVAEQANGLVLATGGGLPLKPGNAVLLRKIGQVIWLTAPAETILRRVGPDLSLRPLLAASPDDPLGRIADLLAERAPHYSAAADLIWDTSDCPTHVETARRLAQELCHLD